MTTTDPNDLDAIQARCNADVTLGPWEWRDPGPAIRNVKLELCTAGPPRPYAGTVLRLHGEWLSTADAEFIAHAREDVPRLLDENRDLRAEVERLTAELAEGDANETRVIIDMSHQINVARRERHHAEAEVRRMRPVVEAAEAVLAATPGAKRHDAEWALQAAMDAYTAGQPEVDSGTSETGEWNAPS